MKYEKAKNDCHVRSSIFRTANPSIKYAKNHLLPFDMRVPLIDQKADDWEEADPNDFYNTLLGADSY